MNWEMVQAVGEAVAALGVLASLVYLAAQVRLSGKRALADTIQRYVSDVNALRRSAWETEDGTRLWLTAISPDRPEDPVLRSRLGLY